MDLLKLTIRCMVVKKIVLSQKMIVPQKDEIGKIVSLFHQTYKGEGARKIQHRTIDSTPA